jgi:hypothetical protein
VTSELQLLYCPSCERECLAEIPPCADGHDELCPDRACVECGTAVLFDAQLVQLTVPTSRAASSVRHAA